MCWWKKPQPRRYWNSGSVFPGSTFQFSWNLLPILFSLSFSDGIQHLLREGGIQGQIVHKTAHCNTRKPCLRQNNNIFAATEMGWFSAKSITRKPNLLGIDKMKFFRRGEFRVKLSIKLRGPTELFNTRKPCLRQNKKNISGHRDGLFKSKKYHSTV